MRSRCPVARSMSSALSASSRATAPPTLPYPSSATGDVDARYTPPQEPRRWLGAAPEAVVQRRVTARVDDRSRARTTQETRIDDVEMISMFTPASASASNMSAATPGMALHPRADQRDLRDVGVAREAGRVDLARDLAQDRLGGRERPPSAA